MDEELKPFIADVEEDADDPEVGKNKKEEKENVEEEIAINKKTKKISREKEEEFFEKGEGQLTIDVYQNPDEIIIEAPIAGVNPDDLDINITNESVSIKGKREKSQIIKDEDYFYQECYWGRFSRSVILPQEIDAEKAEASLKNGVLTIHLPKLNRQRSKKIKVTVD